MLKRFSRFLSYVMIISIIMPSSGVFGLRLASAATVMAVDSFGSSDTNDVPDWVDGGGSGFNSAADSQVNGATPRLLSTTNQHAQLRDGGSITKTVSTSGYKDIVLNYYWRGTALGNAQDKLLVQWKKTSDNTFITIASPDLNDRPLLWSGKISLPLPVEANNGSIDIRFVGASSNDLKNALIDDVSLDGNPLPPPILAPIGNQTVNELATLAFTATSTDLYGSIPLYDLTQSPAGATIDALTGAFSWTPTEEQGPGVYTFTVRVLISEDRIDTETFTVTVNEVNLVPTATAHETVITNEDTQATITLSGSDVDVPAQTLTYGITSPSHGTATLDGATVTYTPNENYNGSDAFFFTVNDGVASSTPATISLTVNSVNDAPIALDTTVATHVNTPLLVTMVANDLVDGNNNLTYTLIDGPLHGTVGSVEGNKVTYTPNEDFVGVDEFTFKTNDGELDSNVSAITINVSNQAPTLQEIGEQFTIPEGVPFTLTALGTDPDQEDTLTYGFGIDMLTAATIDPVTGVFNWTPEEVEGPGTYQFVVTVSDGVASDSKMFTIVVTEVNVAPVLGELPSEVTIPELAPYTFTATATDADRPANTLTYSFANDSITGAEIDSETGVFSWTPTEEEGPGTYQFTIRVSDGDLYSDAMITINVTEVTPPDMCLNLEGIQETVPEGFTANDGNCTRNTPPAGGGGGFYSLGGCMDKLATNFDPYVTTDNGSCVYTPKTSGTVGETATSTNPVGEVLGASTTCGISITKYLRSSHKNDSEQVKKLQKFLNDYLKLNIPLTGVFGPRTERAVKQFQTLRKDTILAPWKLDAATGVVYLTTATDINNILCPDLKLPIPTTLVPFIE